MGARPFGVAEMQFGEELKDLVWIDPENVIFEGVKTKLTPMISQFLDAKKNAPGAILLFRMGDFYECFFQDARRVSEALDLVLTSRTKNEDGDELPMAGVPVRSVDDYVTSLVEQGYIVAICEQLEDPAVAVGIVRRGIVRVVTPGTVLDERAGAQRNARYLSAMANTANFLALASIDLATGHCVVSEIADYSMLVSEFQRLGVCELVAPACALERFAGLLSLGLPVQARPEDIFEMQALLDTWQNDDDSAAILLQKEAIEQSIQNIEGFGFENAPVVLSALAGLLCYLRELHYPVTANILAVHPYKVDACMQLDAATMQNLELFESLRGGKKKGSLLAELDSTVSSAGSRMLKEWMAYPLKDKPHIDLRLEAVQDLYEHFEERQFLRESLGNIIDYERIATKIATNRINPRELRLLASSLLAIPVLKERAAPLRSTMLRAAFDQLVPLHELATRLECALREDAPINPSDGAIFNEGYDADLDHYHTLSSNGQREILHFEAQQKKETAISSLKVKYQRIFGYFIEVSKSNLSLVPAHYIRKQTLSNCERFYTPALKELEEELLVAQDKKVKREAELLEELKAYAGTFIARMSANARALARIDVLCAFAHTAHKHQYCRPSIKEDGDLVLKNARHPVVERFLPKGERFVPNDMTLRRSSAELLIITGPNMAGKSTIIRQTAIIALMAQMGSFVPAEYAHIGIVDRIFSRIGASDNLAQGQSTFMVEMTQTAHILEHATANSLIILDEIGRGTATYDGLSLAWAIAEHLHVHTKARTLFATHYHELTELENIHSGIKNCSVAVKEHKQDIIFLRKLVEGAANRSYGIAVARLAGIPQSVIQRAQSILHTLETQTHNDLGKKDGQSSPSPSPARAQSLQHSLFGDTASLPSPITKSDVLAQDFLDEFCKLGLDTTSPIQALNWLYKWQKKLR